MLPTGLGFWAAIAELVVAELLKPVKREGWPSTAFEGQRGRLAELDLPVLTFGEHRIDASE